MRKKFLGKFVNSDNFKLRDDNNEYGFNITRPLSEPITYSFTYSPIYNGVLIGDQSITINVLANGDVTGMSSNAESISKASFDNLDQKKERRRCVGASS
ncbi:hypothetical protein OL548_01275 [Lysinibacillus sp. MHQ-1]|nr:hypothetical protein OL548_01275 [Lysinibacillus sp. MHQ-1]